MKLENSREEWYEPTAKVAVTLVDVREAAQTLAKGHLCGPVSAKHLAEALAAAALIAAETSEKDEVLSIQMKCTGPLGGLNVECAVDGALRGYTEKKLLDEFDGAGAVSDRKVLGSCQYQVTRSVPGRILSQGIASSLDGYLAGSLQRKACMYVEASVNDEVEVLEARGILVEELPDAPAHPGEAMKPALLGSFKPGALAVASRNVLGRLGLDRAELRKSAPLKFGCRCSPDRAAAMLAAMPPEERATLPESIDVTCHMCGRTFVVHPHA